MEMFKKSLVIIAGVTLLAGQADLFAGKPETNNVAPIEEGQEDYLGAEYYKEVDENTLFRRHHGKDWYTQIDRQYLARALVTGGKNVARGTVKAAYVTAMTLADGHSGRDLGLAPAVVTAIKNVVARTKNLGNRLSAAARARFTKKASIMSSKKTARLAENA